MESPATGGPRKGVKIGSINKKTRRGEGEQKKRGGESKKSYVCTSQRRHTHFKKGRSPQTRKNLKLERSRTENYSGRIEGGAGGEGQIKTGRLQAERRSHFVGREGGERKVTSSRNRIHEKKIV